MQPGLVTCTQSTLPFETPSHEGAVVALYLKPAPGELLPVDSLEAVGGRGFAGDWTMGKRRRQALLVSTSDLDRFGYAPGALRENITVNFSGLQSLAIGTILRLGNVEFEIMEDCVPCARMARRLREDREQFIEKMSGNRGMLCRVRTSGTIRVGDRVQVLSG